MLQVTKKPLISKVYCVSTLIALIERPGAPYTCTGSRDYTHVQLCVLAARVTKGQFHDFASRNKNTNAHLMRIRGIVSANAILNLSIRAVMSVHVLSGCRSL